MSIKQNRKYLMLKAFIEQSTYFSWCISKICLAQDCKQNRYIAVFTLNIKCGISLAFTNIAKYSNQLIHLQKP